MRRCLLVIKVCLCLVLAGSVPCFAQQNPALQTAVSELLESYLKTGPSKEELGNGSAIANWAVLKGVALPRFKDSESLAKGQWETLFEPVRKVLDGKKFGKLRSLEAITLWEETRSQPPRFVRILGKRKLLNPKEPKGRNQGRALREAIGKARLEVSSLRGNTRFEDAGWKFTGSASLSPGKRVVRLALSGSQLCKVTGTTRTVNLNLKGRLFEDLDSPEGVKVQVLEREFKASGCELDLKDQINSNERLAGGGEATVSGRLVLKVRDDTVSGRYQIDLVSKQAGVALLTGRAVYTLKGKVGKDGELEVELVSVSSSGSRVLRKQLDRNGLLRGRLEGSAGSGILSLPVLKEPLRWNGTKAKARVRKTKRKR